MTREMGGFLRGFLDERRRLVERSLDGLLPSAGTPPGRLHEAMRYSVFSGGKRLRPILTLAACEVVGGGSERALQPACATELVHTYSLIHDDLPAMDDDDLRRGRPTSHRVYGEALAILAGDALLTAAFEAVASSPGLESVQRAEIVAILASANGSRGMVGGQAADIEPPSTGDPVEDVTFIHTRKTAMPLAGAVEIGAVSGGADGDRRVALRRYGERLGLAFQIADDLLDITGTEEEMGKAVGKDEASGKLTYPGAVGVEASRERARSLVNEAVEALDGIGGDTGALKAIAEYIVRRRT
ncbi:MAG: polyprenyl synthetase family protein [Candidatus Eisenbacteria bacterium]|nr:polyprenyl synthetase family protein [Candidatus Eisenbacteria bacterium]